MLLNLVFCPLRHRHDPPVTKLHIELRPSGPLQNREKNRNFNVYHAFETIMLILKNVVLKIVIDYKAGFKH